MFVGFNYVGIESNDLLCFLLWTALDSGMYCDVPHFSVFLVSALAIWEKSVGFGHKAS